MPLNSKNKRNKTLKMQKNLKLMMLLLVAILFLEGCDDNEQETSIEVPQYTVEIDGDQVKCFERSYKMSHQFIGALDKFKEVEIFNCNKVTGYRPKAYVRVFNLMEWVRLQIPSKDLIEANQAAMETMK